MTSPRRAARKSAAARRQDIVEAVLALLAEEGAGAVSTPAIARRVGVTQSALFRHYGSKEAVWRAVMDRLALEVGGRLAAAAAAEGSHAERLLGLLRAYLRAMIEIPALPALLFSTEVQAASGPSDLREEIARRFEWLHLALERELQAGAAAGEFRRDLDTAAAAVLAAGIAQSLLLRWRVTARRIDMLAEADRVFPVFLAGVG